MTSLVLAVALALEPRLVETAHLTNIISKYGTVAATAEAFGEQNEYAILKQAADAAAAKRKPNTIKVLHIIVCEIDAPVTDLKGAPLQAKVSLTDAEVQKCKDLFDEYKNLVHVYTGGALQVDNTTVVLTKTVTKMDPMGNNRYWLSGYNGTDPILDQIPERGYDSICVYYKRPPGVEIGLLGGAIGRDGGIKGCAHWTQWMTGLDKPTSPFHLDPIVSYHEWLHNVSSTAKHIMGDVEVPDVHASEEYGRWNNQGGYFDWMCWYRDLTLRIIPREFWYRFDGQTGDFNDPPLEAKRPKAGNHYAWSEVASDWNRKLPKLSGEDLGKALGIREVRTSCEFFGMNRPTVIRFQPSFGVFEPLYFGKLDEAPLQVDNTLIIARAEKAPDINSPFGGFDDAPMESMAVLRSGKEKTGIVFARVDMAPSVLHWLHAENKVLGFVTVEQPTEHAPVSVIAAQFDWSGPSGKTEAEFFGLK